MSKRSERPNPGGQLYSELVIEIFRLNRLLLDAGDDMTRPAGLSSARWQVLGVIEHGPAPVAHIARKMGLTRQGVQQTADSLAAAGLISYSENPHHRRAKLLNLTPAGQTALDQVKAAQAQWADALASRREPHELASLLKGLKSLRADLESSDPEA